MADVRPLFGSLAAGQETIPDVVSTLEDVLARAKLGEVRAIAIAYIDGGDCCESRIRRGDKLYASLVGAVAIMQSDLIKHWNDG